MQITVVKEYKRALAIAKVRTAIRKYFPPVPSDRPLDVSDATEMAIKDAMPGFHVHVSITRISAGNGNGGRG